MPASLKLHSAAITARINFKHDVKKHKSLAHQIRALDLQRIQKHLDATYSHGPVVRHNNEFKTALLATMPFSSKIISTVDVTNAVVTYTIDVGVGANDDKFTLLIDTGSANTFVGANKEYKKTKTSQDTGKTVKVSYGSGSFTGKQYIDRVTLSDTLVIGKQGISVTTKNQAEGFDDVDGILGIGPVELTVGTVSDSQLVPTVTDNLYEAKVIPKNSIGIGYTPTLGNTGTLSGELTFGGEDESKYTGELSYVPITSKRPAGSYWGIDQSISYSADSRNFTPILNKGAGILDTGTTLLYLASDAFSAYQRATGAVLDANTGLLKLTTEQFQKLGSLYFSIGGRTYELVPDAQIWPRELNTSLGGDADAIYLVAADSGTKSGSGLDFINGFVWLQRFYTVYDTENSQIGIANTQYTKATSNFDGSTSTATKA